MSIEARNMPLYSTGTHVTKQEAELPSETDNYNSYSFHSNNHSRPWNSIQRLHLVEEPKL